ncbi:MAG: glycosyltransferase family 4 protein [Spirochaetales bacterium]|nr:glycosyltransferase family 4 protein [Spirochaetales bacterium]
MNHKTTLLFLSWRDIKAPKKGGAEIFTHEMMKRADRERLNLIHFSPLFEGAAEEETIDGVRYIRRGGILSVIGEARKYYQARREEIDYVVDQCNTHRFFTPLWVEREKRIFFIHQLTREIWFRHMPFPLSLIGYLTESPLLRLSRRDYALTVSPSTREDLLKLKFREDRVFVLPEGIDFPHWKTQDFLPKNPDPTFIYVGRYARYKGIDDTIEAFGLLKREYKTARLIVVGKKDETYLTKRLIPLCEKYDLEYREGGDVDFKGFVTEEEKLNLMSRSHCLVFPSLREGWGLIITEAAAVGTPSLVYDSPGTRDAVDRGKAGYLCEENRVKALWEGMKRVIEEDREYKEKQEEAHRFSLNFHWENTGKALNDCIAKIEEERHVP